MKKKVDSSVLEMPLQSITQHTSDDNDCGIEQLTSLIDQINKTIIEAFSQDISTNRNLYESCIYSVEGKAKRIRPLMAILARNLFSKNPENLDTILYPSLAIELFHSFTLVHDDILDKSVLRRDKPCVYKKWGEERAILCGDVLFVKSIELLTKGTPKKNIQQIIEAYCKSSKKVCEGQSLDLDYENNRSITESEYINMIALKTGELLGFSFLLGGLVAESEGIPVTQKNKSLLYECGVNLGIAFQIQDDLFDVFSTDYPEENENKCSSRSPEQNQQSATDQIIGEDIISNKTTFMTVKSYQMAQENQKNNLDMWYSIKYRDEDKVNAIKTIFKELDIEKIAKERTNYYFEIAKNKISEIETTNAKWKVTLLNYIDTIIGRKF